MSTLTADQAAHLIRFYCAIFEGKDLPEEIAGLWRRYSRLREPSEAKTMRWLGFAQGAAVALGIFTLDEVKEHSRAMVFRHDA